MIKKLSPLKLFLLLGGLFIPLSAQAHATPTEYNPPASAIIQTGIDTVSVKFSENIEPKASNIKVTDPDNNITSSTADVNQNDRHILSVPVATQKKGTYIVTWSVISADDGHYTKGSYAFSIGSPSQTEDNQTNVTITHTSSTLEGLSTGIELLGCSFLLGVILFLWTIKRPLKRLGVLNHEDEDIISKRLHWMVNLGTFLMFIGGLSYLAGKAYGLESIRLDSGYSTAFKIFIQTTAGWATIVRLAIAAIFWFIYKTAKNISLAKIILLETLILIVHGLRSYISHAAASSFHPYISVAINLVHVVFKDLWIGTLTVFCVAMAGIIAAKSKTIGQLINSYMSRVTALAITFGGPTGAYVVWLHLKDFSNILTTDWGKRFVILSALAGALLTLRLFHQLITEASLQIPKRFQKLAEKLPITYSLEMWTGIAVLLISGFLIITTPPTEPDQNFNLTASTINGSITFQNHPYRDNTIRIAFKNKSGQPLPTTTALVTLSNPNAGITNITTESTQLSENSFVISEKNFKPDGNWNISITGTHPSGYESTASFNITTPQLFQTKKDRFTAHQAFTYTIIIIALASLLLGLFLLWLNKKTRTQRTSQLTETDPDLKNSLHIRESGSWSFAALILAGFFYVFGGLHSGHGSIIAGNFERLCTQAGNTWHEDVPLIGSIAFGSRATPGCMLGHTSLSHFSDQAEYKFFTRKAESKINLTTTPKTLVANTPANLQFQIINTDNKPEQELINEHGKLLHATIMNEDGTIFSHTHPDLVPSTTNTFNLKYTFPKAGKYLVAADYVVRSTPITERFYLTVTGTTTSALSQKPPEPNNFNAQFQGYDVKLFVPKKIQSGQPVSIKYNISQNGKPVEDLEPYLTAPIHIILIRDDLLQFVHTHGTVPTNPLDALFEDNHDPNHTPVPNHFGPEIVASPTFPTPGRYHIFSEFKHQNKIITTHFIIDIK